MRGNARLRTAGMMAARPARPRGNTREMRIITSRPVLKLTAAAAIPSFRRAPRAPLMRPWTGMARPEPTARGRPASAGRREGEVIESTLVQALLLYEQPH